MNIAYLNPRGESYLFLALSVALRDLALFGDTRRPKGSIPDLLGHLALLGVHLALLGVHLALLGVHLALLGADLALLGVEIK